MSDGGPQIDTRGILIRARLLFNRGDFQNAARRCREVLGRDPSSIEAMSLLGSIAEKTGASDTAISIFSRVLSLEPANLTAHLGLGSALSAAGKWEEAIGVYQRATALSASSVEALNGLGTAQIALGDRETALATFERALRVSPGNDMAAFMANGLRGKGAPPSAHIVRSSFDRYADNFESHLVEVLRYHMPRLIAEVTAQYHPSPFAAVLDLGCGTGLLADAMSAAQATAMDGVDLAPKMIAAARQKKRYRSLVVGDITDYLGRCAAASYDLVVSADVFIYVGPLEQVFAGVDRSLRPDGLFCFSVEHTEADGYEVQASSRYAHGVGYIDRLAARHGFERVASSISPLRRENGADIAGRLELLRRSRQPSRA